MSVKLGYSIKFVADMNKAVHFYKDTLGLTLKFSSPDWTEFATGETSLALHISSELNPPGGVQLGFWVPDIQAAYEEMQAKGVTFTQPPTELHGQKLARFLDADDSECSLSGN